jgi:hypothetical protein
MAHDKDGKGKAEYMGQEHIKKDIRTSGKTRNKAN